MQDWKQYYSEHTLTAQEAVKHIKNGDRVVVTHAAGEPVSLVKAMVDNKEAYRNVEVIHCVSMGMCEYCLPENEPYFRHNAWFVGGTSSKAVEEGRAVTQAEALEAVKQELKALNSDVEVDQEEYDEVVTIKPIFLNEDYR